MKQINIAITDNNQYFKLGFMLKVNKGFSTHGIKVNITQEEKADIILRAPDNSVSINFCHTQALLGKLAKVPLYISILENASAMPKIPCNLESGSITRQQKIEDIVDTIMSLYIKKKSTPASYCPRCRTQLTFSEGNVCRLICQGHSQNQMATLLGVSSKTVSIHKRSAMRKLNIENDIEFLRWLHRHSKIKE